MTVFNWAEYQDLASELANANNVVKKEVLLVGRIMLLLCRSKTFY